MEASDNRKYPNESIMNIFLIIGKKMDIFNTIIMKIASDKEERRYISTNAVDCLVMLSDYLGSSNNETEKKIFLKEIEGWKKEEVYLIIGKKILELWEKKNTNNFEKEMIKRNRERLSKEKSIDINDLPIIPDDIVPVRWIVKESWDKLIHEIFQDKLDAEKKIKDQADNIQKDTEYHVFWRSINTEEIDILKKDLN